MPLILGTGKYYAECIAMFVPAGVVVGLGLGAVTIYTGYYTAYPTLWSTYYGVNFFHQQPYPRG